MQETQYGIVKLINPNTSELQSQQKPHIKELTVLVNKNFLSNFKLPDLALLAVDLDENLDEDSRDQIKFEMEKAIYPGYYPRYETCDTWDISWLTDVKELSPILSDTLSVLDRGEAILINVEVDSISE